MFSVDLSQLFLKVLGQITQLLTQLYHLIVLSSILILGGIMFTYPIVFDMLASLNCSRGIELSGRCKSALVGRVSRTSILHEISCAIVPHHLDLPESSANINF